MSTIFHCHHVRAIDFCSARWLHVILCRFKLDPNPPSYGSTYSSGGHPGYSAAAAAAAAADTADLYSRAGGGQGSSHSPPAYPDTHPVVTTAGAAASSVGHANNSLDSTGYSSQLSNMVAQGSTAAAATHSGLFQPSSSKLEYILSLRIFGISREQNIWLL